MKAAIRNNYCSPQQIEIKDIEKPKPGAHEVLIKVKATTVNRTDEGVLTGKPYVFRLFIGILRPRLTTLGTDFAGIIEAVGAQVNSYKVGDRVFGFHDEGLPSQAEYMTRREDSAMMIIPEKINFAEAAASLEGAHYARNFIDKLKLESGQKVLINGSTGAIGTALVQFCKNHNLYVTAVCNAKNISLIKSLGADKIINYEQDDFTKDNGTYDYLLDTIGNKGFAASKHLLNKKGAFLSTELGPYAQFPFLALFTPLFAGRKVIFPLPTNIKASLAFIKELLEQEKFTPVIDRRYSLDQIKEAYAYVLKGHKTGNVIVEMG